MGTLRRDELKERRLALCQQLSKSMLCPPLEQARADERLGGAEGTLGGDGDSVIRGEVAKPERAIELVRYVGGLIPGDLRGLVNGHILIVVNENG